MTRSITRNYAFNFNGLTRYALNRALRLYPQYWLVMLFGLAVVSAFPKDAFILNFKLIRPDTITAWLSNIFIVGLLNGTTRVLVPPAWSLDIEIVFYALMGLGLSRSKPVVVMWFLASLGYTAWMVVNDVDFVHRYASYVAASLPFSSGAMLYVYRDAFKRFFKIPLPITAGLLAVVAVLVKDRVFGDPRDAGFYILFASSVLVIISLNNSNSRMLPQTWQKIDRLLGELAYPIFLCHWAVATLVLHFVFGTKVPADNSLWLASIVFIHLLGLLVYYLVDYNVHLLRDKVRGKELEII